MAEIPDISNLSSDEVNALLEKHDRPVLCMVPKERIDFFQSREDTNQSLVTEYQESLTAGDKLPPSKGFFLNDLYICKVYDGIHTATARIILGEPLIPVLLRLGTNTDVEIAAAGANHKNGARRSNGDKRKCVKILLHNPELACRSNNWLAEIARVSPQLVEEVRIELENDPDNPIARPKKRRVRRGQSEFDIAAPAETKIPSEGSEPEFVVPEKVTHRIVTYIGKQLDKQPVEERGDLCERIIEALKQVYSLG